MRRIIAQRVRTGEFLSWQVPLTETRIARELSGPGGISGTITPKVQHLLAEDGLPLLREWSTALYYEADGQIRGGGLVTRITENPKGGLLVEAPGFSSYPHGIPFTGVYRPGLSADPLNVVRHIWSHVQAYPDGDLGLTVSAETSGTVLDEISDAEVTASKIRVGLRVGYGRGSHQVEGITQVVIRKDNKDQIYDWFQLLHRDGDRVIPESIRVGMKVQIRGEVDNDGKPVLRSIKQAHEVRLDGGVGKVPVARLVEAPKPYVLAWWENRDCGAEIDSMLDLAPADYIEQHTWNDDHTAIRHHLKLGHPRLGRKRRDLRFVEGENIVAAPALTIDGDEFAQNVVALGRGEGRKMIRETVASRDDRLRRVAVVADKSAGRAKAERMARDELHRRNDTRGFEQVVVRDHPNARLAALNPGDDILVEAHLAWYGRTRLWVRVLSIEENATGEVATLTVARSDEFRT